MKAAVHRWLIYLVGAGVLSPPTGVSLLTAQIPAAAVDASVAARGDSVLFDVSMAEPSSAGPDEGAPDDFIHRNAPVSGLWELSAFAGPLFISDRNSFRDLAFYGPTSQAAIPPLSTFRQPSFEVGVRGGYYPLSFFGAELEGLLASAETTTDEVVTVLGGRGQVVVQSPFWSIVPFLLGGFGYWNVRNAASGDDVDPAFHYGGGAKINVSRTVAVRADLRDSITSHRGDDRYPHNIEILASATLVLGRPDPAPTVVVGPCIDVIPPAPIVADSDVDADGIPDATDPCPLEPGVAPTGCPDTDRDGFIDRIDACAAVPGMEPDGCLPDADGDGIARVRDACPDHAELWNGFDDADGCPDELPADVRIFVVSGVQFDTGVSSIAPGFVPMLLQIASVLAAYPSIRVEIVGHTDDRGTREHNLELSRRRAESVQVDLIARGIDPHRIHVRGEGPDFPLTSNDTPAGRQTNRRSEFRLVR